MTKKTIKNNKTRQTGLSQGFTLIEVLLVVSIMSLLSSILLVSVVSARTAAIDSKRYQDVQTLGQALDLYYQDNGYYPTYTANGNAAGLMDSTLPEWSSVFAPQLVGNYIRSMPNPVSVRSRIVTFPIVYTQLMGQYAYFDVSNVSGRHSQLEIPYYNTAGTVVLGYFCMRPNSYFLGMWADGPETYKNTLMNSFDYNGVVVSSNYFMYGGNVTQISTSDWITCPTNINP